MAGRFHDGEIWPNRPALLVPRGECILCMLGKDCPPDISHHPHQWIFFWHFVIYDFVQSRFCLRVLDHDNKTKHEVKIGQRSRREAMFQVTYSLPPGYYRIISRLILCCFQVTSILLPFYFQVTSWLHPYTNLLVISRLPPGYILIPIYWLLPGYQKNLLETFGRQTKNLATGRCWWYF